MVIIGVTGTLCSGKGAVIDFFKARGFESTSLSDRLREEAKLKNIELTRENLQLLGNSIREKYGSSALAILTLEKIKGKDNFIIDSIRNPGEVEELKKIGNFKLISVDAPRELRIDRLLKRYNEGSRKEDPVTKEEIENIMAIDEGKDQNSNGQQVLQCIKLADFHIFNDKDISFLHKELEKIFKNINS